jgi:glutathione peroxidase
MSGNVSMIGRLSAAALCCALVVCAGATVAGGEATEAQAKKQVGDTAGSRKGDKQMAPIYEFTAKALDGKEINFKDYQGDVLLIVNTASHCGFTPQYAGLEDLHKKYEQKGLKVLGFPCNQFGQQEPGTDKEIGAFCQKNYGVDFQMFDKIDVNGAGAHPLYKYLTSAAPGILGTEPIKWNFTKFLVDRKGQVVKRFGSNVAPNEIAPEIEKLL